MELKQYQAIKYALSEIVRALPWCSDTALRNRILFERLAMDRFNVAVVGRYSRGKSTLLNALTGLDRLPMGAEPLTSVITSLRYGTEEKAIVHFQATSLTEDIPLSVIKDYVTEHGNHANRRRIQEVEIILQSPILKSGFRFIDTPGIGSIIHANTETTLEFLSEIDVFVFVTACDSPLGSDENSLLREIASIHKPLFPVLNKADLASDLDLLQRSEVLHEILRENGLMKNDQIFCLSAVQALEARLSHDDDLLQRSGLLLLEQVLSDFLLKRRRKTFLTDICARLTDAVKQDSPRDAAFLLSWVENIRHEVATDQDDASHAGQIAQDVFRGKVPPCPVCQHVEENVFDHLTFLQGALRSRQIVRTAFLQDGGLCAPQYACLSTACCAS
ncbi:dynamin family protein [Gluconobacter morbifer]|uniref:Dynamin N-terminal domain-containing protein n=1 Tax=Gluconobacter morbifer G707 TaxID=1088869 RepID=G6XJN2_9PROT|nr:dynamin family protein [Gluconobacter morbifer]EHH67844.1 hypothetical protein GMO_16110 [Gluconobacter morbifer G707]